MSRKEKIIHLAVTNSLTYDQRMMRICLSLHQEGYDVRLVGIDRPDPLPDRPYKQIRLTSWFRKGKLFYLENHLRLFFFLLFRKTDLLVANDLDTALPVWLVSKLRNIPRLMDAHEYFTEMKEVLSRPSIHRIWSALADFLIPRFPNGYTVGPQLSKKFLERYGVQYGVIRNVPIKREELIRDRHSEPFILYQGAVNEGRGFETLIPAMRSIPYRLVICGDGNFMDALKKQIEYEGVSDRVHLTGMVSPEELRTWALRATLGISLPDSTGANQFLALPNKFFNNIEAGLPQITCRYPEYESINREYPVAVLIDRVDPIPVAEKVNQLIHDSVALDRMREACRAAREKYCWQREERALTAIYQTIFSA